MKFIIACFYSLCLFGFAKANDITFIEKHLQELSRVQSLTLEQGKKISSGLILTDGPSAYFITPDSDNSDIKIKISWAHDTIYNVQILQNKNLITFKVNALETKKYFSARKLKIDFVKDVASENGVSYWAQFKTQSNLAKTVLVKFNNPIFSKHNLVETVQATGPVTYKSCDGCEHGDQMLVGNINVATLNFGDYYQFDCEGLVTKIFSRLLKNNEENDGLAVPMTFKGLINLNSSDLTESIDDLWNADQRAGELFLGTSKVPLKVFLDNIVKAVAKRQQNTEESIRQNILKNGQFVSFENNKLEFRYEEISLKADTETGLIY